jgi:predicted XRE-type DNA-binding protein
MKIWSQLMSALCEEQKRRGLTQAEAAKLLGVSQPRISDLFRGRISLFSIDVLVLMMYPLGFYVGLPVRGQRSPKGLKAHVIKLPDGSVHIDLSIETVGDRGDPSHEDSIRALESLGFKRGDAESAVAEIFQKRPAKEVKTSRV